MKKVPKIKIPEKYNTLSKKVNYIGKKIDARYDKAQESAATATRHMVKMGEYFINAKRIVKEHKGKWKEHVRRRFPYLDIRTVERYMKLGRHIDLKKYPALAYISQSDLLILIGQEKKIGSILKIAGVNPRQDLKGRKKIGGFKKQVHAIVLELNHGWIPVDINESDGTTFAEREMDRQQRRLQGKIAKHGAHKPTPGQIADRINKYARTLRRNLSLIMDHRPEVFEKVDMDLLEDLISNLKRFFDGYERDENSEI